jgi:hypothetical protein
MSKNLLLHEGEDIQFSTCHKPLWHIISNFCCPGLFFLGEKGEVYSHIIQHFGGNHNTRDKQAVHIQRSDKQVWLAMDKTVNKHISHHKARRATACVFEDALQILGNADSRSS